jgi:hypothetical protein
MRKVLYQNWYYAQTSQRRWENEFVLAKNIESGLFNQIVMYCRCPLPRWARNQVCGVSWSYPTFKDFFNICQSDSINIIANTDIYFDETLNRLSEQNGVQSGNSVVCLSRWERKNRVWSVYRNHRQSQDAWMFKGILPTRLIDECDFRIGTLGCDNRLVYTFQKYGYITLNPAFTIKAKHVHFSNHRYMVRANKDDVVPPPYLLLPAHA